MYAIGPIGGMVLAAMTLRLPENLLSRKLISMLLLLLIHVNSRND